MPAHDAHELALKRVVRNDAGRVLAALILRLRDFDLAEESLQEAYLAAHEAWPTTGVPHNPAAWLMTVARRKALDRIRRRGTQERAADALLSHELQRHESDDHEVPDERLRLIFTCCHPALALEAQVALTLRTLCGLSTEEIARAFLVPEATMAQRLVRAKTKMKAAGIPYREPAAEQRAERLDAVLAVIYLIFNQGYSSLDAVRQGTDPNELCADAIHLGRVLHALTPEPEVGGVLALMLLHDARRAARRDTEGAFVPLDEQERSRWDQDKIREGTRLLHLALAQRRPGRYQIQAAISALHAEAASSEETDWPQIAGLYAALERHDPTPVVALNRAVALSRAGQLAAAMALLDSLRPALDAYQPFHAATADIWHRAGRLEDAAEEYALAAAASDSDAEREFLLGRRAACVGAGPDAQGSR